jgi:ATP-dependent protease ClpP protease subunit
MVHINHSAKTPELFLYEEIGPGWLGMDDDKMVISALAELKGAERITVRINSPGGDVFVGNSIFNALQRNPAEIHTEIDGLAASIASVIALAGETVNIAPNAMMMIHPAWTMTMGNAADHRKALEVLDKVDAGILDTYSRKTGRTPEELSPLVEAETWLTAEEAVSMGFADGILEGASSVAARIPEQFGFKNIPERLKGCVERREWLRRETRDRPKEYPNLRAVEARRQRRAAAKLWE